MIRVYIAGSFTGRHRIAKEIKTLPAYFKVLGRWFDDGFFLEKQWNGDMGGDVACTMAKVDVWDILSGDLVIVDSVDKSSSGGSDTELGAGIILSMLKGITVIHIGPYRNIFQTLANEHYETWDAFREHLGRTLAYDV